MASLLPPTKLVVISYGQGLGREIDRIEEASEKYPVERILREENCDGKISYQMDGPRQREQIFATLLEGLEALEKDFEIPFFICTDLPLPKQQPVWEDLSQNPNWEDELSPCICSVADACGPACLNRFGSIECDDNNCAVGSDNCKNRPFSEQIPKSNDRKHGRYGTRFRLGVEAKKLEEPDRGEWGLRATRYFEPHQKIVEYTGKYISRSEIYPGVRSRYLIQADSKTFIDAAKGGIARFINHSCEPNCNMERWNVKGKVRVALFAGDRPIKTGDELEFDYRRVAEIGGMECHCGRKDCRGIIGPKEQPDLIDKGAQEQGQHQHKVAVYTNRLVANGEAWRQIRGEKQSKDERPSHSTIRDSSAVTAEGNEDNDKKESRPAKRRKLPDPLAASLPSARKPITSPNSEEKGTKPQLSLKVIISIFILRSPAHRLKAREIHKAVMETYSFYRFRSCMENIRSTLSNDQAFFRIESNERGSYWSLRSDDEQKIRRCFGSFIDSGLFSPTQETMQVSRGSDQNPSWSSAGHGFHVIDSPQGNPDEVQHHDLHNPPPCSAVCTTFGKYGSPGFKLHTPIPTKSFGTGTSQETLLTHSSLGAKKQSQPLSGPETLYNFGNGFTYSNQLARGLEPFHKATSLGFNQGLQVRQASLPAASEQAFIKQTDAIQQIKNQTLPAYRQSPTGHITRPGEMAPFGEKTFFQRLEELSRQTVQPLHIFHKGDVVNLKEPIFLTEIHHYAIIEDVPFKNTHQLRTRHGVLKRCYHSAELLRVADELWDRVRAEIGNPRTY